MSEKREPFIASLFRRGEASPYATESLDAADWVEAKGKAGEWAMLQFAPDGGVTEPTSLHLSHESRGKFIREWSGI